MKVEIACNNKVYNKETQFLTIDDNINYVYSIMNINAVQAFNQALDQSYGFELPPDYYDQPTNLKDILLNKSFSVKYHRDTRIDGNPIFIADIDYNDLK